MIDAIVGHLVGDYLLQNDWMALNKKRNPIICMVHCLLWTAAVCCFAGWRDPGNIAVLLCSHFIQDHTNIVAWWMRLRWKDQSQFMRCDEIDHDIRNSAGIRAGLGPWSIIVVDNVWHIVTIWAVWRFMTP